MKNVYTIFYIISIMYDKICEIFWCNISNKTIETRSLDSLFGGLSLGPKVANYKPFLCSFRYFDSFSIRI